jgi:glycyl-tRNA synthetase beta chain
LRGSLANRAGQSQDAGPAHRLDSTADELVDFFEDRLKVQQRDAGVRHDLIDAVFALGGEDDLVRLLARVNALQKFVETKDGADLLTAYKRAANILKKENWTGPQVLSSVEEQGIPQTGEEDPLVLVEDPILKGAVAEIASGQAGADLPQERALIAALDKAEPKASAAIDREDFTAAMAALASLRKPIDDFFDHVTVNDPDPAKRERRLNLLMRFRDAVNQVADFSRIEG